MIARRLGLAVTLIALLLSPQARASELREQTMESPALGRAWSFSVYLPDGYSESTGRYPVIFLLPGLSAKRGEWLELTLPQLVDSAIASEAMVRPIVVVPEIGASWGLDGREHMQSALIDDLLPEVARRFRTLPGRGGRAIAGISAGGFAALRLALLYPDRFAAVALLSPAIYTPEPPPESGARRSPVFGADGFDPALWQSYNYPTLLPGFLASGERMPLYIGCGAGDRLGIAAHATHLHALWRANNMQADLHIIDGDHSYAVWRQLLTEAMGFLLRHTDTTPPGAPGEGADRPARRGAEIAKH